MIVRLKKRGEFPFDHTTIPRGKRKYAMGIDLFKGCCIEVEPTDTHLYNCGGKEFDIVDSRVLSVYEGEPGLLVCEHYFIDDLQAFDSDFCDEEAQEGDLAFVQIPAVTR